jgi:hypothetical protein
MGASPGMAACEWPVLQQDQPLDGVESGNLGFQRLDCHVTHPVGNELNPLRARSRMHSDSNCDDCPEKDFGAIEHLVGRGGGIDNWKMSVKVSEVTAVVSN